MVSVFLALFPFLLINFIKRVRIALKLHVFLLFFPLILHIFTVPLWIAIHLRKQQKCRIVPPTWMDKDILEEIKETEKRNK